MDLDTESLEAATSAGKILLLMSCHQHPCKIVDLSFCYGLDSIIITLIIIIITITSRRFSQSANIRELNRTKCPTYSFVSQNLKNLDKILKYNLENQSYNFIYLKKKGTSLPNFLYVEESGVKNNENLK